MTVTLHGKRAFVVHQQRDELAADEPVHRVRLALSVPGPRDRADEWSRWLRCPRNRPSRSAASSTTQNCPAAVPSSVVSGSVQMEIDTAPAIAVRQDRKRRTAVRVGRRAIDENRITSASDDDREDTRRIIRRAPFLSSPSAARESTAPAPRAQATMTRPRCGGARRATPDDRARKSGATEHERAKRPEQDHAELQRKHRPGPHADPAPVRLAQKRAARQRRSRHSGSPARTSSRPVRK